MKYINKGDSRLPKVDFVVPEFQANPARLQSMIAHTENAIRACHSDIAVIKAALSEANNTGYLAHFRNLYALNKRSLMLLVDTQVQQKHMMQLIRIKAGKKLVRNPGTRKPAA